MGSRKIPPRVKETPIHYALVNGKKVLSDDKQSLLLYPDRGAIQNREVQPKRSYNFDGVDDYIEYDYNSSFNFGADGVSNFPFTITTWINPNDATSFRISSRMTDGNTEGLFLFDIDGNDKLRIFIIQDGSDLNSDRIGRRWENPITAYEGNWIFLKASYNGGLVSSDLDIQAFELDGTEINLGSQSQVSTGTFTVMSNAETFLYIGRYSSYADGKIFDYRMHDKVLTSQELEDVRTFKPSGSETFWAKCDESNGVISYDSSGNMNHGIIQNATLATFHYKGSDVPYSFQNKIGYNIQRQFFDIENWTQTEFPDRANAGIDSITYEDDDTNTSLIARINSEAASTDEDFAVKESGVYNDNDGLGSYWYNENATSGNIFFQIVLATPIPAGRFQFVIQVSHVDNDNEIVVLYNGLANDVNDYLDTVSDTNNILILIGGERYDTQSVIDWINDAATTQQEIDDLNALMPIGATFLDIAQYNAASDDGDTNTLLRLRFEISTETATTLTTFSGDFFTDNTQNTSGERGWFIANNYVFPEISQINVSAPRIGGTPTWVRFYADQSFIEGQSLTPRDESNITKDIDNFELDNKGEVINQIKIANVNVGNPDGVDDKLSFSNLSGVTIVSSEGTSTPTINGNDIEFTAGTIWTLELSNGSFYSFNEGSGNTVYDISGNGNHGTWTNVTNPTQYTKSDIAINYLMVNGVEIYDDDATGTEFIYVPFKNDGTRISPTISGFTKLTESLSIEKEVSLSNNYDCEIDFQHFEALPDDLPIDYEVGDSLPNRALIDESQTDKEKSLLIAGEDISANQLLTDYTNN